MNNTHLRQLKNKGLWMEVGPVLAENLVIQDRRQTVFRVWVLGYCRIYMYGLGQLVYRF